jgi:tartrate dehydrogenase/decarboxylase/D-malate dehydrogenase
MATTSYRIATIPGDGIGCEVVPVAQKLVNEVAQIHGFTMDWTELDWSCERYLITGTMMPDDGLQTLAAHDAIFLGAVGWPSVPDHVSLWGLLIPIRREFDLYINLRPVTLLPGIESPLRDPVPHIDFRIVRENTEGEYSEVGGRFNRGTVREVAVQESVFTRVGIERTVRFAAELASQRSKTLISATKSNGIIHSMTFWDEVVQDVMTDYPDVSWQSMHVDALAARLVSHPQTLDVIVASNLFGDILSDIGAAVVGSLGVAPSANINPQSGPGLFEPVHGSAPDIAGMGIANPIGQVWSAVMMLENLGESAAAELLAEAINHVTREGQTLTKDLGGHSSTTEVGDAISQAIATLSGAGVK